MVSSSKFAVLALLAGLSSALTSKAPYFRNATRPLVVCHRASSGRFPQHSLAAEDDCYFQGTDMIELDIHPTRDGHLVVNHDSTMSTTTDIHEFAWLF
jgi:glycerophosphoryl diester phosphodiesterase